jgi:hypothetical protein
VTQTHADAPVAANGADPTALALARFRAPRRRRWPLAVVSFAAGAAVALGVGALVHDNGTSGDGTKQLTLDKVAIERRDLGTSVDYSGTLASTDTVTIAAARSGTVTDAVPIGTAVSSGTVVAAIDGQPVTVVEGSTPAYRDLGAGVSDGADVQQLEAFLVAAGYDPNGKITVDQTWTSATTTAVKAWQQATGQDKSGTVAAAQLAFVPHGAVVSVAAKVGEPARAGQTLVSVEVPTTPSVTLAVAVDSLSRFTVGENVDVVLPDGSDATGTVATIGSIATRGQGNNADLTVQVTVTVPASEHTAIEGPVTVRLPDQVARGVLAVPTRALLALAEGGQAVEVVDGAGATHLVGVQTGTYADGYVEVTGNGLAAGEQVVVPR